MLFVRYFSDTSSGEYKGSHSKRQYANYEAGLPLVALDVAQSLDEIDK
jgi:hypothetical protein